MTEKLSASPSGMSAPGSEGVRLYRSAVHPGQWIAYLSGTGWVAFPAKENGWEERRGARGLDPLYLRQVPLDAAAATGFLDAFQTAGSGKAA